MRRGDSLKLIVQSPFLCQTLLQLLSTMTGSGYQAPLLYSRVHRGQSRLPGIGTDSISIRKLVFENKETLNELRSKMNVSHFLCEPEIEFLEKKEKSCIEKGDTLLGSNIYTFCFYLIKSCRVQDWLLLFSTLCIFFVFLTCMRL